jgi:hypothetical protein
MKTYKITFSDGNTITTGFNGTSAEAKEYYTKNSFQFGDTDERPYDVLLKGVKVEMIDVTDLCEKGGQDHEVR